MFDFRYHALSLVAVFLALAVGLLLGVAIGDRGLVSGAEQDIRASLRADVRDAQAQTANLNAELAQRTRFEQASYPALVRGRLARRRVAVIGLGGLPDPAISGVRDALSRDTGAELIGVGVVRAPLDLPGLANRLNGTAFAALGRDSSLVGRFGRRVGRSLARGGQTLERVRPVLLAKSSTGSLDGVDTVVLVRALPDNLPAAKASAFDAFARGLIEGLTRATTTVVGVETTFTDPSQIAWFKDRDLSSVDNVDQISGHASLVFVLAGAVGSYGVKATADGVFPPVEGSPSTSP